MQSLMMQQEQVQRLVWWQWPWAVVQALLTVAGKAPTAAAEAGMAVLVTVIGVWLWSPIDTFGSAVSFREMANFAPECVWGMYLVALGIFKAAALGWTVLMPKCEAARRAQLTAAGLILVTWIVVWVMIASVNPSGLSTPIFGCFSAGQVWIFIRQGRRQPDGD